MRRLHAWRDCWRTNPARLADERTPVHGRFWRSRLRPGVDAGLGEAISAVVSLVHEAPAGRSRRPMNGPDNGKLAIAPNPA